MFLKHYQLKNLRYDIPAGIIVALVSIPISMGYAQVSGLPAVYGLYGSLLPILVYGLITSSPRFVFGVDAAPAALTGGMLASMGIAAESDEALRIVPVIALVTAGWLFLFWIMKAGKLAKYISKPVLGGFVTGICCEIIIMQIPKLFGGKPGHGELIELILWIHQQARVHFSLLSLILGLVTVAIILIFGRVAPRIPMSVIMMGAGALLTLVFHVDDRGVLLLPAVKPGLPVFLIPQVHVLSGHFRQVLVSGVSIAAVIVAETLLSTGNYAQRYGDRIDNSRELLAYAAANLVSALSGSCPVNGSVSRTGIADGLGVKSQMMSVTASLTMLGILLFATGFIRYLPVPVLTAIVIAALIRSTEFHIARQLMKVDRTEFVIFWIVFFTVLFLGTIYGVVMGVILSFFTVVVRASRPQTAFLGCIPGKDEFRPLQRMREALPIRGVVLYQFTGQLFFANIDLFQQELEAAVDGDTRGVIVDARAVSSIDITATERLVGIEKRLKKQGIRFFLTGHDGTLNDLLRAYRAAPLFRDGCLVPAMSNALDLLGIHAPYDRYLAVPEMAAGPEREDKGKNLVFVRDNEPDRDAVSGEAGEFGRRTVRSGSRPLLPEQITFRPVGVTKLVSEYEWLFGEGADAKMQEFTRTFAQHLLEGGSFSREELARVEEEVFGTAWSGEDEEGLLDILEMQFASLIADKHLSEDQVRCIREEISRYHASLDAEIGNVDHELFRRIVQRRIRREERFRRRDPELFRIYMKERELHQQELMRKHPEVMKWIQELRSGKDGVPGDRKGGRS